MINKYIYKNYKANFNIKFKCELVIIIILESGALSLKFDGSMAAWDTMGRRFNEILVRGILLISTNHKMIDIYIRS